MEPPVEVPFVELAAQIGAACAPRAADHNRENTFVAENFPRLRDAGYLRLPVPSELGGMGASMRQVCYAQAELARFCGSTALAVNMHLYLTLVNAFRWRRGGVGAEGPLRRIAAEGIVLMTSGASDGIYPSARAERVDGGYRVSGRKAFCSQAPVADVFVTSAVHDDPQAGHTILMLSVPMRAGEGVGPARPGEPFGEGFIDDDVVQAEIAFALDAWPGRSASPSTPGSRAAPPATTD